MTSAAALARARTWFVLAGAAVALPIAMAIVGAVMETEHRSEVFKPLPEVLLAAAAFGLMMGLDGTRNEKVARGVAFAAAINAVVLVLRAVTPGSLGGALTWVTGPITLGGLAFLLAARPEPQSMPPRAVKLAVAFAAAAWMGGLLSWLIRLTPLPMEELARHGFSVRGFVEGLSVIALAVLAKRTLADAGSTGSDAPLALQQAVMGLRSLALWTRVRAAALLLLLVAAMIALGQRVGLQPGAAALTAAAIAVLTGPWVLRSVILLRRVPPESGARGPATLALIVLLLHACADGLLILFASDGRSPSQADLLPLAAIVLGSVLTAVIADSALLVSAGRVAAALGNPIETRRPQLQLWLGSLGWLIFSGAILAFAGQASRRAGEIAMWTSMVLTLTAISIPFLVSGVMLRATGARPLTAS